MKKSFLLMACCSSILYLNASESDNRFKLEVTENNGTIRTKCQRLMPHHEQDRITFLNFNLNPIKNDFQEEIVLKKIKGEDGRRRILDTENWPNSVHGVVKVKFPSDKNDFGYGSGTLISPYIVLTAAHNLYRYDNKEKAIEVSFIPGINNNQIKFEEQFAKIFFYTNQYKKYKVEDYGIIILNNPIGEKTGYFGIEILPSEKIKSSTVTVSGYPGDKITPYENGYHYQMWFMSHKPDFVDDDLIKYSIDTFRGQSGAGAFYKDHENYYILGVHIGGNEAQQKNLAIRMTSSRFDQIQRWIQCYYNNDNLPKQLPQSIQPSPINRNYPPLPENQNSHPYHPHLPVSPNQRPSHSFANLIQYSPVIPHERHLYPPVNSSPNLYLLSRSDPSFYSHPSMIQNTNY